MGRFLSALGLLGVLLSPAYAFHIIVASSTVAPAYVGYLDLFSTSVYECWDLRACGSAQATGTVKAGQVTRASDSTTQDILILSTGALDEATKATFCAATTCVWNKLYGQVNGHDFARVASDAPADVASCIGSLSCIDWSTAGGSLQSTDTFTSTAPYSPVCTLRDSSPNDSTLRSAFLFNSTGEGALTRNNGTTQLRLDFGSAVNITLSAATWYAVAITANGVSGITNYNGSTDANNYGSDAQVATVMHIGQAGHALRMTGCVLYAAALTAPQQASLVSNARAYWGF